MDRILSLLFLIFFSSVKFLFAAPLAVLQYKLSFPEAVLLTTIGGFAGVMVFAYLSKPLSLFCKKTVKCVFPKFTETKRRKFSFKNRLIVKIKRKYGLPGLVIFTPVLISIPIGAFLAMRYYPRKRTLIFLLGSVLFWSLSLNAFYSFFAQNL